MPRSVGDFVLKDMIRQKSLGRQVTVFVNEVAKKILPLLGQQVDQISTKSNLLFSGDETIGQKPRPAGHHRTIGGRIILIKVTDETRNKI